MRTARGFSLVELMVALLVSLIVIAGAVALMVGEQRSFQTSASDRYLQETARIALDQLGNGLRNAGFGVDPALAFDLGPMTAVRMDRAPGNQTFNTTGYRRGDGTACAGLCRDSTTGPDEIVFYSRDPGFGPHPLTVPVNATTTRLTFALVPGQANVSLQIGQVLQLACYTGNMSWAYVTVSSLPTANGDGTASVSISNTGSTAFPNQTAFLADGCFGSVASMAGNVVNPSTLTTAAEVFKVDRYHYYVQSYDAAGNPQPWGTLNTRPFLMLDQGLTVNNAPQASVVAPDVEDLQLEYVFPRDAVTPLVGATAGAALTNGDAGVNLAPASGCPIYSDAATAATRQNHHPGNIAGVRVGIVVRSQIPDVKVPDTAVPAAGNRAAVVGQAGFRRLFIETTVAVPNLSNQAPYYPYYAAPTAAGNRTYNAGGG